MRASFLPKDCTGRLSPLPVKHLSIVGRTLKVRKCLVDSPEVKRESEGMKMFATKRIQAMVIVAIVGLGLLPATLKAQKDGKKDEPKPIPADAHAVLWQEPTDITPRDLFLGSGGAEMKPDLSHVVFLRDETRSYSKRYRVCDGA